MSLIEDYRTSAWICKIKMPIMFWKEEPSYGLSPKKGRSHVVIEFSGIPALRRGDHRTPLDCHNPHWVRDRQLG